MTDAPTSWLIQKIQAHATEKSLWFCDENLLYLLPDANTWPHKPAFITNRWDVSEYAQQQGFDARFNDVDLKNFDDSSVDHIFYRISKEKAVTHHFINQAQRALISSGTLWISGQKNEGIKTYIEKASTLFGCEKNIQKDGMCYSSQLIKQGVKGEFLNADDYEHLRECFEINSSKVWSKPGQFGWNKIDQGSEFLITNVEQIIAAHNLHFDHCLDLGCGYGYLTVASKNWPIKKRTLTDNNAAALETAHYNCAQLAINAEVIASNAGQHLSNQFDLILCNPPFHQGFSVDGDLTEKFLQNTQQLLRSNGVAYFVVNQFIPLEKKAAAFFKSIKLIAHNKSFKVFELRKTSQ